MKEILPIIRLKEISKGFQGDLGYNLQVLDKISFEIFHGEFGAILSPRGSGKSTLLKIISEIYKEDSGYVERLFKGTATDRTLISYIPSLPSSYPWLNVQQNIGYFQRLSHLNNLENKDQVKLAIEMVGLKGYENHYPDNRSLGFRFRISLARSLVSNPALILVDEPFNEMEVKTKEEIYFLLRSIWEKTGITFLFSTSNVQEAFLLSNSIILLSKKPSKVLEQIRLNLPVKRDREILKGKYFAEVKEQIDKVYTENELSITTVLTV